MNRVEFETMQGWERLRHRVSVDYTRELIHQNCWLASNKPYLLGRKSGTEGSKPAHTGTQDV